jgi:exonuclease SbcD
MPHVKFLHTADLHLSKPFGFLPPAQAKERRRDQRATFGHIVDLAIERKVDIILFSGDVFDNPDPDPTDLEAVIQGFMRLSQNNIINFVIPGNHDYVHPNSFWHKMNIDGLHIFTDINWSSVDLPELGLTIYGSAYDVGKPNRRAFEGLNIDTGFKTIVMAHASYESFGTVMSSYHPFSAAELAELNASYTALGHYHKFNPLMNRLSASYPGTPEGISFDTAESGSRYVIFGEIGNEIGTSIEPIQVNRKVMKSDELDCTSFQTEASLLDAIRFICEKNALIEIKLQGTMLPELIPIVAGIPDRFRESCQYMSIVTNALSSAMEVSESDMTIRGRFYQYMMSQINETKDPHRATLLRKALELGIAALDGRRL